MYCPQCETVVDEFETLKRERREPINVLEIVSMDDETLEFMTEPTDPRKAPRSDSG
jgi:hypothetical protein